MGNVSKKILGINSLMENLLNKNKVKFYDKRRSKKTAANY